MIERIKRNVRIKVDVSGIEVETIGFPVCFSGLTDATLFNISKDFITETEFLEKKIVLVRIQDCHFPETEHRGNV